MWSILWAKVGEGVFLDYGEHLSLSLTIRYVYDHIGENHDNVMKELMATIATFSVTTLWLGPCEIVYIWSVFNCFGLNFELWVQKFFQWEPLSKLEVSRCAVSRWGDIGEPGDKLCSLKHL